MIFTLATFGIITGFTAGFFGIGGGMVLVPMLLMYGFDMKEAVSISIMQMLFSSIFGSFLNIQKQKNILKLGTILGVGGFIGGLFSGYIVAFIHSIYLQYIFLLIILLAIYMLGTTPTSNTSSHQNKPNWLLGIIGAFVGSIAMSIGVGGSVMLVPILTKLLHYNIKTASSLGLFFVSFSSIAGFVSLSITKQMIYFEGAIVAITSLIGVFYGIYIKDKIKIKSYKKYILILYIVTFLTTTYKTIIDQKLLFF